MRTWPALDVRFDGQGSGAPDPEGFFAAFLDDYAPSAIIDISNAAGPALRVFFACERSRDDAAAAMAVAWPHLGVCRVDVPDEHWAEKSQASLTAIRIDRLVVTPPWDVTRAGEIGGDGGIIVVIEPSMGFGTGHHESTRLCLRALQQVALAGHDVLDLGTGSGVLAIAAARLGCRAALGLDDDPDAIAAAAQNVARNGVADRVVVRQSDFVADPPRPAQVVVGNLTGALLRREAAAVRACVAPGGVLILSGFTQDERLAVAHAFLPLAVVREEGENGWLALTLSTTE